MGSSCTWFVNIFLIIKITMVQTNITQIFPHDGTERLEETFEVRMALLIPKDMELLNEHIGYSSSAGAITVALERVKSERLLEGAQWSVITRFTQCSENLAAGMALEVIKKKNCSVIVGPPCSVPATAVAVLSKAFNVPQLNWAATSIDLENFKRFPTVAGVIGSSLRLGRALKEILLFFNWKRFALIYTDDQITRKCQSMAEGLRQTLAASRLLLAYNLEIDSVQVMNEAIDKFLNDLPHFARIVIACFDNEGDMRTFLLRAHKHGLTTKEYVYILPDYVRDDNRIIEKFLYRDDGTDEAAGAAFKRVLMVEILMSETVDLEEFKTEIMEKVQNHPFYEPISKYDYGSLYSPFLHDAIYLYALALNKTIDTGGDINNGLEIINATRNIQFVGLSGNVVIDNTAARQPNFVVTGFSNKMKLRKIARALMYKKDGHTVDLLVSEQEIWETRGGFFPSDVPECGFKSEKCQREQQSILAIIVISLISATLFMIMFVTGVIAYIRRRLVTNEMAKMLWKVNYKDILFINDKMKNRSVSRSLGSVRSLTQNEDTAEAIAKGEKNAAMWNGILTWAKQHHTSLVLSNYADHAQMKELRDINNENVNAFVGVCLDAPHPISLWKYCTKGSLEDVIYNENIKLDWFFKYSLLKDLVGGMDYLCDTSIKTHGRLRSTNCVVDNRWILKITDYGLSKMRLHHKAAKEKFWTAPELLREQKNAPLAGTMPGDVYSFAIIVQEVILRDRPFGMMMLEPEEIVCRIGKLESPPFRPKVQKSMVDRDTDPAMVQLMMDCWKEDPEARPDFRLIKAAVRQMARGKAVNLMDHVMKMMEKYAGNLEETITDRTKQLTDEMLRADLLLQRMLPRSVADKLKTGQAVDPENYDSVTVLFSDVVGFTTIASRSTPMQIVYLLNEMYTLFDDVIAEFDVYKVETIGDGYMCASGLPHRNGDRHASEIADMALQLMTKIKTFVMPHLPDEQLQLRIGAHSGPAVAGIVGTAMPRYCLFGDTVNVANRMESTGKASCIQISEQTHRYLAELIGGYVTKPRGEIIIKGKGVLFTYWLLAKSANKILDQTNADMTSSGTGPMPQSSSSDPKGNKSGISTPESEPTKQNSGTSPNTTTNSEKDTSMGTGKNNKKKKRKKKRKQKQTEPEEDDDE